jgi:hypothetical protein
MHKTPRLAFFPPVLKTQRGGHRLRLRESLFASGRIRRGLVPEYAVIQAQSATEAKIEVAEFTTFQRAESAWKNSFFSCNLVQLGRVAQLGERLVRNEEVAGSSPATSTIFSIT